MTLSLEQALALIIARIDQLEARIIKPIPPRRVTTSPPIDPTAFGLAIAKIKAAGPLGITSAKLRDLSRTLRRAIEANPLPSELAEAGVMCERVGKAIRYYIPDFM